jgi:two-component system, OmpR family, response regulator
MTAAVFAHRTQESPSGVVATVTLQVLLGGEVRDPGAAVREWLDHLITTAPTTRVVPRPGSGLGPDGVLVDVAAHSVSSDGRQVDLCRREFELLLFLARHPRQVFTRGQLLAAVWAADSYTGKRTVDVHVNRLRNKLGRDQELITTVHGVGYRLADGARVIVLTLTPAGS